LRNAVYNEIEALQDGARKADTKADTSPYCPTATAAFLTDGKSHKPRSSSPSRRLTSTCAYCKDTKHRPNECNMVTDPQTRFTIASRDNLCFNCLGPHNQADCTSHFRCVTCNGRHHSSLHDHFQRQNRERGRSPQRLPRSRSRSPSTGRRQQTPIPSARVFMTSDQQ